MKKEKKLNAKKGKVTKGAQGQEDFKKFLELCMSNKVDGVKSAISANFDFINMTNAFSDSGLTLAIKYGAVETVEYFLSLDDIDVNQRSGNRCTPLHYAALFSEGKTDIIDMLFNTEVLINARNSIGYTPLHAAISVGASANVIERFIKESVDVNTQSNKGRTPLHSACDNVDVDAIKLLIDAGAFRWKRDENGYSPYDMLELQEAIGDKKDKIEECFSLFNE